MTDGLSVIRHSSPLPMWLFIGITVGLLIGLLIGIGLGFSIYVRAGTWD